MGLPSASSPASMRALLLGHSMEEMLQATCVMDAYMYMYIYMRISVYANMYICMFVGGNAAGDLYDICTRAHMYVCISVYAYMCIYV